MVLSTHINRSWPGLFAALLLAASMAGQNSAHAQYIPATGEEAWTAAVERADQRISALEEKLRFGSDADVRSAALTVQKDPIAVARVNKNGSPALKGQINKVLDAVKSNTRDAVRKRVAAKYHVEPHEVTFFEATNPSAVPKVGQDWDMTVRVRGKDVPIKEIRDIVHDSYYEAATGKPSPPRPAKPARPAKPVKGAKAPEPPPHPADVFAHEQAVEVINSQGTEAYGGSKSEGQRIIEGPKNQELRDPHQISDAIEVKSNLPRDKALSLEAQAKKLQADALKAEAAGDLGKANEYRFEARQKVLDAQGQWMEQARQYDKQFNRQVTPRVEGMGGEVPEHVQKGSKILKQIADGDISPAEGRAKLKAMGETPETMINKGASLVESSQTNRAPSNKGPAPPDVFTDNVKDRLELNKLKEGPKPPQPAETPGAQGKPAGAKPSGGKTGKLGAAATEVAGGVGMGLAAVEVYVDYQACLDEGKSKAECDKGLALAAGGLAVLTGAGGVAFETLAALGVSATAITAVGTGLAVLGVPAAAYAVYHAGQRWANAPETKAKETLKQQQKQLLMGYARMAGKVQADFDQLQQLRSQTIGLCRQINSQVQSVISLDQDSRARMGRLQALIPSVKEGAPRCGEAQSIVTAIEALERKSKETESAVMADLDTAIALADKCGNKTDADKIRELYRDSKERAARLQADAAIARGRNNRLDKIKADADQVAASLQAIEEIKSAIGANNARMRDLASSAIANRDKANNLNTQFAGKRAAVAERIEQLAKLLPDEAPSQVYEKEFEEAHNNVALLKNTLAETAGTSTCAFGEFDPGKALLLSLESANLFGKADGLYISARESAASCSATAPQDKAVEEIEAIAGWVLSAVEMNNVLPQKADACLNKTGAPAAAQCPANAAPAWSEEKQKNVCRCVKDYKVSDDKKACVPDQKAEPVVIACNTTSKSGANPPETIVVNVGRNAGTAYFKYDMKNVPDHMIVQYGGQTLADTGCVSGSATLPLALSGANEQVTIIVKPACRKSDSTVWNFTLSCPGPEKAGAPQPGATEGRPAPANGPGAASPMQLETVTGNATATPGNSAESKPLKPGSEIRSGASMQTGAGAQVVLKSPTDTRVTIGGNTQVRVTGPDAGKQIVELRKGTVDVNRKQGLPGFDDIVVRTQEGTAQARDTRYRVQREERGTHVQVFEGTVHLAGNYIIRMYAPNVERGKPSPAREMDLRAGEQALMGSMPAPSASSPSSGQAAPSMAPPAGQDDNRGKPSSVPAWLTPSTGTNTNPGQPGGAANTPLTRSDPWNDARVQQLIDEWLRNASPVVRPDLPGPWRFTEWGQLLGPGSKAAGAPDHPAGWSRHQSLWAKRAQFDSLNLCTMGEYVERRIAGKGIDGCGKAAPQAAAPAWLAPSAPAAQPALGKDSGKPSTAIAAARDEVAQLHSAPRPREQAATVPRHADDIVASKPDPQRFVGDWDCTITNEEGKTAKMHHSIIRDSAGKHILQLPGIEGARFAAKYVDGNRIGFVIGDGTTGKDVVLDFKVDNNVAVGTDRIEYYDGRRMTYAIRCNKTGISGGRK